MPVQVPLDPPPTFLSPIPPLKPPRSSVPCTPHALSPQTAAVESGEGRHGQESEERHYTAVDVGPRFPARGILDLQPGATFVGEQRSGRNKYGVQVDIKHVSLDEGMLCGELRIRGLTEERPDLTTYFEAEIVGPRHSFLTRKWDADEFVDRQHWLKFPDFQPHSETFHRDSFTPPTPFSTSTSTSTSTSDLVSPVFMRLKEHFLVPDHTVRHINGASFAGFYYACYDPRRGVIEGYYYHRNSEWFQRMVVRHVKEGGGRGEYEMR